MKTQTEYEEFDFKKGVTQIVAKVEKQSYRKLSFLMIGCAALLFGGYTGSNILVENVKQENTIQQQKQQLFVNDIKQMDEREFSNMLDYISKNVDMYNAKVTYVQEVIIKASGSEFSTTSTSNAKFLGESLTDYKNAIKEDVAKLILIRKSVNHDIKISQDDIDTFFKYMGAYKSKLVINNEKIDNRIHRLIYDADSGNQRYNQKNNVYEKIKEFDLYLKNFEFIDNQVATKPKM